MIAIVGCDCRVPGANNPWEFWDNICEKRCSVRSFSKEEALAAGEDQALCDDPAYIFAKGVLDDLDAFDADFFGINHAEAALLDPQARLFLETSFRAIESSGYNPLKMQVPVGVFGSIGLNHYLLKHLLANPKVEASSDLLQLQLLNDKDYFTSRVAYHLNLKGPTLTVQTGCSSSLTAVHIACMALRAKDCDMALAGGVSISLPSIGGYVWKSGGIGAKEGVCYAFDQRATGTVRGDGVGVVVLKRLEDAERDGDEILAVIRGSAVNNDGRDKVGYTAPSLKQQKEVIEKALHNADVEKRSISYIETHGTGTTLGDPIEAKALIQAYSGCTHVCYLSTLKPNIGHLDVAAGISSLIKVVFALKTKRIPPAIHFSTLSHHINFEKTPFEVNVETQEWSRSDSPRRAGVSAFGMGGTNCHVILEEAPARQLETCEGKVDIVISAKSPSSLKAELYILREFLMKNRHLSVLDIAYTMANRRLDFPHKAIFSIDSLEELIEALIHPEITTAPLSHESKNKGRRVFLPPYQFEKRRFWIPKKENKPEQEKAAQKTALNLKEAVVGAWSRVLGREGLDLEANFFDLGGDSLTALKCLDQLAPHIKEEISLMAFFQYPKLGQFINYIEKLNPIYK